MISNDARMKLESFYSTPGTGSFQTLISIYEGHNNLKRLALAMQGDIRYRSLVKEVDAIRDQWGIPNPRYVRQPQAPRPYEVVRTENDMICEVCHDLGICCNRYACEECSERFLSTIDWSGRWYHGIVIGMIHEAEKSFYQYELLLRQSNDRKSVLPPSSCPCDDVNCSGRVTDPHVLNHYLSIWLTRE